MLLKDWDKHGRCQKGECCEMGKGVHCACEMGMRCTYWGDTALYRSCFLVARSFFVRGWVSKQARQASRTVFGFSRLYLRCGRIYWLGGWVILKGKQVRSVEIPIPVAKSVGWVFLQRVRKQRERRNTQTIPAEQKGGEILCDVIRQHLRLRLLSTQTL